MGNYNRPKWVGKIVIQKNVEGKPIDYLRRWYLTPKMMDKWCSVRIHQIVLEDQDRHPHNHPWPFLSIVLKGGYMELWGQEGDYNPSIVRKVSRWSYHTHTDVHRITGFKNRGEKSGVWTLVFTGPLKHKWGFQTEEGLVPWDQYENA